jgi:carbon monoxide dehydrogenase subunit G
MAFSFDHSFIIKAPADRVWAYLTDPYRVAPALPGASITGTGDDGSYTGAITIKVGPVSARYRGKLRFDAVDAAARTVQMVASGQDTSGRGGADMRMSSRLVEKSPGETEVNVSSNVTVTGMLAQFGRGMIQDVSNQMFQKFSESVRAELEKPQADDAAAAAPKVAEIGVPSTAPVTVGESSGPPRTAPPRTASPAEAPPIDALALGGKVAGLAAARMVQKPMFWIAVVAILVILWVAFR